MKPETKIPYAESETPPRESIHASVTGEFRPPRKGEWYASGAIIEAYQAPNDLPTSFWIVEPVRLKTTQRTLDLAAAIGAQHPPIHHAHGTV